MFAREEELPAEVGKLALCATLFPSLERVRRLAGVGRNILVNEAAGKFKRTALVFEVVRHDHLRTEPGSSSDGSRDARAHLVQVARESQDRCAGPENVGGSGVGVALQKIQVSRAQGGREGVDQLTSVVSRKRSAIRPRWMCSFLLATSVKTTRSATS